LESASASKPRELTRPSDPRLNQTPTAETSNFNGLLGGWSNNPSTNWGDVWYSKDGKTWNELKSKVQWKERHEHSAFVFQDRLWVAGGHARPLNNDVWSIQIDKNWFDDE